MYYNGPFSKSAKRQHERPRAAGMAPKTYLNSLR